MNKTVSIHLQGVPFIFEEQAYDRLNSYLQELKKILQKKTNKRLEKYGRMFLLKKRNA